MVKRRLNLSFVLLSLWFSPSSQKVRRCLPHRRLHDGYRLVYNLKQPETVIIEKLWHLQEMQDHPERNSQIPFSAANEMAASLSTPGVYSGSNSWTKNKPNINKHFLEQMWKIFCFVLPAQNMLSVILTEVELRQMFWSTIGRWICWRTDVKFLTAGFQLFFRLPHPVTRPLKPSDIRLPEKIPVRYITRPVTIHSINLTEPKCLWPQFLIAPSTGAVFALL